MPSHYDIRRDALRMLGFASYRAYLASDLWKGIRAAVMERDGGLCRFCGKPAYTAHHASYSVPVLAGNVLSQLISVCRGCHKSIEFKDSAKLVSAVEISQGAAKRLISKQGGKATKKLRATSRPLCRCCGKPAKTTGRDGICLSCYKTFGQGVHGMAKARDQEALGCV